MKGFTIHLDPESRKLAVIPGSFFPFHPISNPLLSAVSGPLTIRIPLESMTANLILLMPTPAAALSPIFSAVYTFVSLII